MPKLWEDKEKIWAGWVFFGYPNVTLIQALKEATEKMMKEFEDQFSECIESDWYNTNKKCMPIEQWALNENIWLATIF